MKTHLKPILWLVGGIAVMFLASLALELYRNAAMLRKFSAENLGLLQQREQQNAENIFATAENAVKDSLERGEMDKFVVLLQGQKAINGLQEFSLFDRKGVVTHSSDQAFVNKRLPAELRDQLQNGVPTSHAAHQRLALKFIIRKKSRPTVCAVIWIGRRANPPAFCSGAFPPNRSSSRSSSGPFPSPA